MNARLTADWETSRGPLDFSPRPTEMSLPVDVERDWPFLVRAVENGSFRKWDLEKWVPTIELLILAVEALGCLVHAPATEAKKYREKELPIWLIAE